MDYDVVFIGSGQAAWNGALILAKKGMRVAIVEKDRFGGTCTNRGCNAKFSLEKVIDSVYRSNLLLGRGIDKKLSINWPDLMIHKHEITDQLAQQNYNRLIKNQVDPIIGTAKLIDRHTINVKEDNGQYKKFTAEKIILSTGTRPRVMDIPGSDLIHSSDDMLNIPVLPKNIVILGAGYIAIEFASMASIAGANVTVVSHGSTLLRGFYQPYVEKVESELRRSGVKFNFDVNVTGVEANNDEFIVTGENGYEIRTDYVLGAVGRQPNVQDLNLENIGIDFNEDKGINVNKYLQTNIDNIYATGDVINKTVPKLTPTAIFESKYLAHLISGDVAESIKYPPIATTIFTSPKLAQVGVTPDKVKDLDGYYVEQYDYNKEWYRQISNEQDGSLTLVFNKNDVLVGATSYDLDAVEEVNTLLDLINSSTVKGEVEDFIYIHPSVQHFIYRKLS